MMAPLRLWDARAPHAYDQTVYDAHALNLGMLLPCSITLRGGPIGRTSPGISHRRWRNPVAWAADRRSCSFTSTGGPQRHARALNAARACRPMPCWLGSTRRHTTPGASARGVATWRHRPQGWP